MIDYCPCDDDEPDPCPSCGATVSGNDRVYGVCQARYPYRQRAHVLFIELHDRETGNIVCSTPVL